MSAAQNYGAAPGKPLRLMPGVILAVLVALVRLVFPAVAQGATVYGASPGILAVLGGALGGLAITVWWLLFSRAPWVERVGAVLLAVVALWATSYIVDPSISTGMMGLMLPFFALPVVPVALVASLVASRGMSTGSRRARMAAAILIACGAFTLVRTGGISGDGDSDLHWRWTPTPEERLLAAADLPLAPVGRAASAPPSTPTPPQSTDRPAGAQPGDATTAAAAPAATSTPDAAVEPKRADAPAPLSPPHPSVTSPAEWPGFRGPHRDGVIRGVRIETDWSKSPPTELWRRPIGPGWSSFAVRGDLVYTQEQRGGDEVVSCYRLKTGEPVWSHRDAARFWESNAGAGPRATPTVIGGRVYTMGATGIVNALNANDGALVWSRNAAADTSKEVPDWGLASSPLVIGDLVIVAASGNLVAYDVASGNPRWFGPTGGGGYSSPHFATIGGVDQILLMRGARTLSVAPATGALLWEHTWAPAASIVQPALTEEGDVLVASGDGMGGNGMRRLALTHGQDGWTAAERWTSRALKPYFNDFVVHEGHAFGFDNSILASIDLANGARMWKGGRYGHGQLVLLPEQDLLLVLSEDGELALVGATADQFKEIARVPALDGKTWNHPVLIGDILLVRNSEQMAAFRLALAGR
jgi:outer membrane protein assembly factor BamB